MDNELFVAIRPSSSMNLRFMPFPDGQTMVKVKVHNIDTGTVPCTKTDDHHCLCCLALVKAWKAGDQALWRELKPLERNYFCCVELDHPDLPTKILGTSRKLADEIVGYPDRSQYLLKRVFHWAWERFARLCGDKNANTPFGVLMGRDFKLTVDYRGFGHNFFPDKHGYYSRRVSMLHRSRKRRRQILAARPEAPSFDILDSSMLRIVLEGMGVDMSDCYETPAFTDYWATPAEETS